MDNIVSLFTSTEGRIGRGQWWLGVVILIVINLLISFLILPLVGLNMMPNYGALMANPNAEDLAAAINSIAASARTAYWVGLVITLILAYPYAAIGVKRRHDKDNNGLDVWIFIGLLLLSQLIQALGLGMTTVEVMPGTAIPSPGLPSMILGVVILVYAIYLLVVLGFLRGTAGPNQYGPDPLGGAVATA
jgi:uncharacterized membrane protein YhaH (DUF805 family)